MFQRCSALGGGAVAQRGPGRVAAGLTDAVRTLAAKSVPAEELHAAAMRAWGLIEEGLATGVMTMSPSRAVTLDNEQYLALVRWAAGYRQASALRAPVARGLVGPSA